MPHNGATIELFLELTMQTPCVDYILTESSLMKLRAYLAQLFPKSSFPALLTTKDGWTVLAHLVDGQICSVSWLGWRGMTPITGFCRFYVLQKPE